MENACKNQFPCDKKCFTKKEADIVIEKAKKGASYRKEKRKYFCHDCNCWHLTKRDYLPEQQTTHLTRFKDWLKLLKGK
jgi:hypothetical protein